MDISKPGTNRFWKVTRTKVRSTPHILERHETLVEEMKERGYNHNSPLEYEDTLDLGEIEVESNIEDLIDRCEDCRKRYEKRKN